MAGEESKIFFSYARREDGEFALKLAQDLRAAGINIWMDQMDIPTGVLWDRAVERALRACKGVLVILSPASVENNNVMDEVSYALEEGKQVLPVLHRRCTLPYRLRRLHYSDFTTDYEKGLTQLLRALGVDQAPPLEHVPETPDEKELSDDDSHIEGSIVVSSKEEEEAEALEGDVALEEEGASEEAAEKVPTTPAKEQRHERSWVRALVKRRSIWIGASSVLAIVGIVLVVYVLSRGESVSSQGTSRLSAYNADTSAAATAGDDAGSNTEPSAETGQRKEGAGGKPLQKTERAEEPVGGVDASMQAPTGSDEIARTKEEGGGQPPVEEPKADTRDPVPDETGPRGDESSQETERAKEPVGEATGGEAEKEEEPPPELNPLAIVREEAGGLQSKLEKAIEDKQWSDVPAPLTDYYKKEIDKLRQFFDIQRASVEPEPPALDGDGSTATMLVTLWVSYVQKGRESVKAVPIQARWTWKRNEGRLTLVSVQGV